MNRVLASCNGDCNSGLKVQLSKQLQFTEAEQTRLNKVAVQESNRKGVFEWLFGWL